MSIVCNSRSSKMSDNFLPTATKRNIVIVVSHYADGGVQRRATVLANSLVSKGYAVSLLVINKLDSICPYERDSKVELLFLADYITSLSTNTIEALERRLHWWKRLYRLGKYIPFVGVFVKRCINALTGNDKMALCSYFSGKQHSVIVAFNTRCFDMVSQAIWGLNCKCVFVETGCPEGMDTCNLDVKEANRRILDRADLCVFQTLAQKDWYKFDDKGIVIRNPILPSISKQYTGMRRSEIVTFSRTDPGKNLTLLIDAFKMLLGKYPQYSLKIFGATPSERSRRHKQELLEHIRDLGIEEKVSIVPAVADVHERIVDSAIFVSTSEAEGLSNSMLEAMALGLPCICTDCLGGGAREMIMDGENGLLVPRGDKIALYNAMLRMLEEPGLAEKCSINAGKVRETLSVENITTQWLDAFENKHLWQS